MSVIRCKFYRGKNVEHLFWLNFVFEPKKNEKKIDIFLGNYFFEIIFFEIIFLIFFFHIFFC